MSIELLVYLSFQMQTIDWTCKKRNRTTRKSVILIAYFLVFVCIYFTTFFSLFLSLHVSCVTQFVIFNSHTIQWQLFLCIVRFVYLYASRTTIQCNRIELLPMTLYLSHLLFLFHLSQQNFVYVRSLKFVQFIQFIFCSNGFVLVCQTLLTTKTMNNKHTHTYTISCTNNCRLHFG